MKRALLLAVVALMWVGVATQPSRAQPYSTDSGDDLQGWFGPGPGEPLNGPHWQGAPWRHGMRGDHWGGRWSDGASGPPDGDTAALRPPSPPAAAQYHFSRGDSHIDITCPQADALTACVRGGVQLLDKIYSYRASAGAPSQAPSQAPGPVPSQAPRQGSGAIEYPPVPGASR